MTNERLTRCENCRWWDRQKLDEVFEENKGVGLCRFSPPVVQGRLTIGQWPLTTAVDWCGDYAYPPEAGSE